MKRLCCLLALLACPALAHEATLCQEKSVHDRSEFWQVEGSPDFGKAFEGIDLGRGEQAEGSWCGYRALFVVNDGGMRQLVRMYAPELSGVFSVIPVTGIRGDGRLIVDKDAEQHLRLPELYDRLIAMPLPKGYSWSDSDSAAWAEQEFYLGAAFSPNAEAELLNAPELRRELSLVEESELIHRDGAWKVSYIDMDAGHILLALEGEEDGKCLHLSHYEVIRGKDGRLDRLHYVASCRFSYGFADIGKPTFSADFRCFLLPLSDEEMGVRTTLRLPACAIGGALEHATGYREGLAADSSPTDSLLRELMLGRYANAVHMLRGGKVNMDTPNEQGLRPSDYIPAKLRTALQAEAAGELPGEP